VSRAPLIAAILRELAGIAMALAERCDEGDAVARARPPSKRIGERIPRQPRRQRANDLARKQAEQLLRQVGIMEVKKQ
jgi:hypothetical protein